MNISIPTPIADVDVFAATRPPSLLQIRRKAEAELEGTQIRDTRSAFRLLEEKAGIRLDEVPATPSEVRETLASLSAAQLGITDKRLANVTSLIRQAVERFGPKRVWITQEIELTSAWKTLLDTISDRQHRWGLSRLACYCTVKAIAPVEVMPDTLIGFQSALEAELLSRDPAKLRKHTIALWNICLKSVPGWPQTKLSSPFKQPAYMLPLEAFPQGFRDDVEAWEQRMTNPDPLDPEAPIRALRPDTLNSYQFTFRRLASALVHERHLSLEEIVGLGVLVQGDNLTNGLRPFLKPNGNNQDYAYKMATQMRNVARHHLIQTPEHLQPIDQLIARLKPHLSHGMGERNRERLAQFDDGDVVQRLLAVPGKELDRAQVIANPFRKAKAVERALMISICIFAGLRAKNLRELRLDQNLRRAGDRLFIELAEDETKNHAELKLEMPLEVIEMLDLFVASHRDQLPGSDGPYLFPGQNGGPRSYSAIRDAVGVKLQKKAGINISSHLYRHAIAKIVIERRPELINDVSRRLGHKSINTTYQYYLGTEGPAASRRINELLQQVQNEETDPRTGSVANRGARK